MGRIIIFVGTPGAGKSSILKGIKHDGFKLLNIGTEMFEVAKKEYDVSDRDDIRKLGAEAIKNIRNLVFDKIRKDPSDIIIDTHASIRRGTRFVPGFTIDEINSLNDVRTIVYVDSTSRDIIARRNKDLLRRRDVEDETDIEEQREVNLSLLSTASVIIGMPIYIIKNLQGKENEAIVQANAIVKEIFS